MFSMSVEDKTWQPERTPSHRQRMRVQGCSKRVWVGDSAAPALQSIGNLTGLQPRRFCFRRLSELHDCVCGSGHDSERCHLQAECRQHGGAAPGRPGLLESNNKLPCNWHCWRALRAGLGLGCRVNSAGRERKETRRAAKNCNPIPLHLTIVRFD